MNTTKRLSAFLVSLVMLFSVLSVSVSAWSAGEGIDVYWNDEKVGTVSYEDMDAEAQGYPDETYSNNKGEYTGKFYKFSKLLKTVGQSDAWSAAPDDTTVVITDAGKDPKPAEFTKAELEETRSYYKDGNPVNTVKPGFMHIQGEDYFRFVFGQKSADDSTSGRWVKLSGTGNATIKFTTPTTPDPDPSEDETQKDGIEVYWNDQSVGSVSYEEMVDGISQATKTYNYSTVNSAGTYSTFNCAIYPFKQLMEAVNKDADWNAAPDSTKVLIKDPGYETELTKATLTEDRYYFDDEGFQADTVKAGFKITESSSGNYLQLVFGQKTKDEQTNGKFFQFKSSAEIYITTPAKPDVEIFAADGTSKGLTYSDLDALWQEEGSKKYNYSNANTYPTFKTDEYWGPTLKRVLAEAGVDLDALADTDVIRFDASDGMGVGITVKDIKATRYTFPNGKPTDYKGTTEAQLKDKTEVPFILSIKNGKTNIRNVFGQIDPQEEQTSYFIKYINKITVMKDAAKEFDGLKPTIADGSTVKKGDKLNFDLELPKGVYEGAIFYTVSTDGTEPAEPTYSDIFYNFAQNRTDDTDYEDPAKADLYNIYEFTDAAKTIVKVKVYVSGYAEPKTTTLTYTTDTVKLNGLSKGPDEKWAMYKDNVVDTTFTGLAKSTYNSQWYYVKDGYLDWNYTGFGQNVDTKKWYRVKDGRVDWNADGIYKKPETGKWYKTYKGRVTFDQTGIYKNFDNNSWWYVEDSRITFKANGVYKNKANNTWWKVTNSNVDFKYNGLASNQNGTWKIKNGKVDFDFSGTYQGKTIKNGKVVS